jgi:cobalt-zinc-cadmium efflux system protein
VTTEHRHEHEGHDHDEHAGHDHEHEGHDYDAHAEHDHEHESHDHDEHAGHDHEHEGHDYDAHAEHDHEHESHDHDEHAGHDHEHEGHDYDAHAEHDHEHDGHDHAAHAEHDHGHEGHDHDDHGHGGHDHHGHGHDHDHAHDLRGASKKSLVIALALISSFMFIEVAGGILSGSLALLADAGHMLTDAAAILLALFAMWIAERPASVESTFGYYRTEVLAALLNTLSLWVIAAWIFFEAFHRIRETPEVEGPLLLGVGVAGLVVNILAAYVLHRAAGESLNAEGAFQHVMADLFGSIGVVVSGVLILAFATSPDSPWFIVDPILSIGIGLLILRSSWGLFMRVFKVLLEGTPKHLDMYRICSDIEDLPGVTIVHDVHAWTITSGYDAMTAHVLMDSAQRGNEDAMLARMRQIAYGYGLGHVTFQLEYSATECEENHHVEHLVARARS